MKSRPEHGFALVELLVTVVVLGIVLTAVATATVSSTNRTIKTDAKVAMNAALEEATDKLQAERPWVTNTSANCNVACTNQPIATNPVDSATIVASYSVAALPNKSGYRVMVTVNALRLGGTLGNPADQLFDPMTTAFTVENGTKSQLGSIVIRSCWVNQVDERSSAGNCAGNGFRALDEPAVSPAKDNPGTVGVDESKLYPPNRHYLVNPKWNQWQNAAAAIAPVLIGNARIPINAQISGPTAKEPESTESGEIVFKDLAPGEYTVEITSESQPAGWRLWRSKSIGRWQEGTCPDGADDCRSYTISVSPGTQSLVTRMWEPKPVSVKIQTRTFDGTVPWDPYLVRSNKTTEGGVDINKSTALRVMLQPFPEGRANIPGTLASDRTGCTPQAGEVLLREDNTLCVKEWGQVVKGTKETTIANVRPGLYSAMAYRSYSLEGYPSTFYLKQRPISAGNLGIPDTYARWQGPSQHPRLKYVYVDVNGKIDTGGSGNPTIMFPQCDESKRDLLRQFAKYDGWDGESGNDSHAWKFHGTDAAGNSWIHGDYGFQDTQWGRTIAAKLTAMVDTKGERSSIGWVRWIKGTTVNGVPGDLYRAAKGGWNAVEDAIPGTPAMDYPGAGHNRQRVPTDIYFDNGANTQDFFVPYECGDNEVGITAGLDEGS